MFLFGRVAWLLKKRQAPNFVVFFFSEPKSIFFKLVNPEILNPRPLEPFTFPSQIHPGNTDLRLHILLSMAPYAHGPPGGSPRIPDIEHCLREFQPV